MSFQDVGKRNSHRQPVNAGMGSSSSAVPSASTASSAASNVFASMSIPAATATAQISDSLTQYHVRSRKRKNPTHLKCTRTRRLLLSRENDNSVLPSSRLSCLSFLQKLDWFEHCMACIRMSNGIERKRDVDKRMHQFLSIQGVQSCLFNLWIPC